MVSNINKCHECSAYTLADSCSKCDGTAYPSHPPRFSPEDRYGKYRRQLKKISKGG